MTNLIQWDIDDYEAENPLELPASFDFNISFEYDPGDEDDAATATIVGATCTTIVTDEEMRAPTLEEDHALEQWLLSLLDKDVKLRQQIEQCGLDQMGVEPDYDDVMIDP